jgi:hypothetical protein
MLSCVAAYRGHRDQCSQNDCKVVLNHLVRKFSEPLSRAGRQKYYRSRAAEHYVGKKRIDHVVPVKVITESILAVKDVDIASTSIAQLQEMLEEQIILCEIMASEDRMLVPHGMPQGWDVVGHRLYGDPWARYKVAGLYDKVHQVEA